jgi:hypothetical protein
MRSRFRRFVTTGGRCSSPTTVQVWRFDERPAARTSARIDRRPPERVVRGFIRRSPGLIRGPRMCSRPPTAGAQYRAVLGGAICLGRRHSARRVCRVMRLPQCIGRHRCAIPIEDLAKLGVTGDPGQPPAAAPTPARQTAAVSIAGSPRRSFGRYISALPFDYQYDNKVIRNSSVQSRQINARGSPVVPLIDRFAPLNGEIRPPVRSNRNRLLSV